MSRYAKSYTIDVLLFMSNQVRNENITKKVQKLTAVVENVDYNENKQAREIDFELAPYSFSSILLLSSQL